MTGWNADDLDRIARADELQVSSHRADGTLRPFVTIWAVRTGDSLYIRSAHGPDNGWFRRARSSGTGRIRAGGVEADVRFEPLDSADPTQAGIDHDYHAKYDRYGPRYVGAVVGEATYPTTLRVVPQAARTTA